MRGLQMIQLLEKGYTLIKNPFAFDVVPSPSRYPAAKNLPVCLGKP